MIIKKVETNQSSYEIFKAFSDAPGAAFLDSGRDHDSMGRYSIVVAFPFEQIESKNGIVKIKHQGKEETLKANPFSILREKMDCYRTKYDAPLPFIGGAVGYLGYDLCHHVEKLPRKAVDDVDIPDMYMGFYHGAVVIDHKTNTVYVTDDGEGTQAEKRMSRLIEKINSPFKAGKKSQLSVEKTRKCSLEFVPNMTKKKYLESIKQIKEYIRSGDIYQANMTQRFETNFLEDALELYENLRDINPAPFASYIDMGTAQIVSSSPERFLKVRGKEIETRPIKGTLPRGRTLEEDQDLKSKLIASEKDRSELLMIVDLERNDLSRVAKTGTVKVPELFVIESYATVHHLVSTVTATLEDNATVVDLIEASFPGGSITGAPKIRAMEVIDTLEPTQRNVYTGSIGYMDFNGNADLNIVIRTIVCKDKKAYFQVGGGIVWDSEPEREYEETLDKAKALMEALCTTCGR